MNGGEEAFFEVFPPDSFEAALSPSGLVNSVPSALSRWTIESRLLDGSSLNDCVNALKPDIIKHLEKLQMVEIQEKVAEEKAKKEENAKKKAATAAVAAAAANVASLESNSTTSSETSITSTTTTNNATSVTAMSPASSSLATTTASSTAIESTPYAPAPTLSTTLSISLVNQEDINRSRRLISTRLTTQDFPVLERESNDGSGGEQMDISPSFNNGQPSASTAQQQSSTDLNRQTLSQPSLNEFETPFNPIPDFIPNAPAREVSQISQPAIAVTPAPTRTTGNNIRREPLDSSQPMSAILAVSPSRASAMETPCDLPRMNQMRSDNHTALTGGLGFTPQIPTTASSLNTPHNRSELPSVAEILATPADIPSLQQLRSGSLFSQGSPLPVSSLPASIRQNLGRGVAPSPLSIETGGTGSTPLASNSSSSSGTSSVVAADLAVAIMSQLVTSSPTPSISSTANTIDSKLNCSDFQFYYLFQVPYVGFSVKFFQFPIKKINLLKGF